MGTYDDYTLETLANAGDGTYAFIDSADEARRVFVDDLAATLNTIASDVKIQVQFNPARVKRYRQIGYENRQLKKEQFRDNAVDAGEVGSGQSVTALYEVEGVPGPKIRGPLKPGGMDPNTLAVVRVRYRRLDTGKIEEIHHAVRQSGVVPRFEEASARFRLAACVAEFAEILRGSPFAAGSECEDVARILRPVALELRLDKRVDELLRMVHIAESLPQTE
jgi:Ca-activated chloride channel family protein